MYYDDLPIWGFIGKIEKILKPGQPDPWKEATEAFKARVAEHGMPPPPP